MCSRVYVTIVVVSSNDTNNPNTTMIVLYNIRTEIQSIDPIRCENKLPLFWQAFDP